MQMTIRCKCKHCGNDFSVTTQYYTGDVWQTSQTTLNRLIYLTCPKCKKENVMYQRFKLIDTKPEEE